MVHHYLSEFGPLRWKVLNKEVVRSILEMTRYEVFRYALWVSDTSAVSKKILIDVANYEKKGAKCSHKDLLVLRENLIISAQTAQPGSAMNTNPN